MYMNVDSICMWMKVYIKIFRNDENVFEECL